MDEAVKSYKTLLAEARETAQRLENEIHDKDTHYCGAIQNERQQRKDLESELGSTQKSMQDALHDMSKMEKENSTLKDKVSRQEKYLEKLLNREKQNRRMSSGTIAHASRGEKSKVIRPSLADASGSEMWNTKERVASSKSRSRHSTDENERPNRRPGSVRPQLPRSPDELDMLLT